MQQVQNESQAEAKTQVGTSTAISEDNKLGQSVASKVESLEARALDGSTVPNPRRIYFSGQPQSSQNLAPNPQYSKIFEHKELGGKSTKKQKD